MQLNFGNNHQLLLLVGGSDTADMQSSTGMLCYSVMIDIGRETVRFIENQSRSCLSLFWPIQQIKHLTNHFLISCLAHWCVVISVKGEAGYASLLGNRMDEEFELMKIQVGSKRCLYQTDVAWSECAGVTLCNTNIIVVGDLYTQLIKCEKEVDVSISTV